MSEESDHKRPKTASRALLAVFVPVMLLTGLPKGCDLHERLAEAVDPVLDVTGTWQTDWKLFAPDVDKVNVALEAELRLSNGEVVAWRSPNWREMGLVQRFRRFRHMAFFDGVRLDANAGAWPSLARHLARSVEPTLPAGVEVEAITLARLWADVPPPPSKGPWPSAREYVDHYSSYVFFERDFPALAEEAP